MKFIAVAFVAIVGIFVGIFIVSHVRASIDYLASERRTSHRDTEDGRVAQKPLVKKRIVTASYEVPLKNLVYPGATVASVMKEIPSASLFRKAFAESEGAALVASPGLYTLFVPVDDAFAVLSNPHKAEYDTVTSEEVSRLVSYHIVPHSMIQVALPKYGWVTTLSGDVLNFELRKNGGTVGNAKILAAYQVDNGVVYVIDQVLVPPERVSVR